MNKLNLKHLRATAEAATIGKWSVATDTTSDNQLYPVGIDAPEFPVAMFVEGSDCTLEDAEHIATMNPETTLALLDVIEQMRMALEAIDGGETHCDVPRRQTCPERAREALAAISEKISWEGEE